MIRILVLTLASLFFLNTAQAASGSLPLRNAFGRDLMDNETIAIDGEVEGKQATVVLRIDDASSNDYASRANFERSFTPGPFHWEIGVKGLRASSGRLLDLKSVRELRMFSPGGGAVSIASIRVKAFEPLAQGALAYSFGAEDAPVFPGFERVLPASTMIVQGHPQAIRRPGPDPLIASGVAGVETLIIPWAASRARVTLWTEDPGDWEMLPHPLERRIRVYGIAPADVLYERYTPDEWYRKRYLRGLRDEHGEHDDAWTAYGQKRGGLISFETDAGPQGIRIQFAGDSQASAFLNAITVEPAGQSAARDEAEARRAAWYRDTWPVVPAAKDASQPRRPEVLKASAAPGTGIHISVSLESAILVEHPEPVIVRPALGAASLDVKVWASQRRLERGGAAGSVLTLAGNTLRADIGAMPLEPGLPRRYDLWVAVPAGTPPGLYRGAFGIAQERAAGVPIEIEVLPVTLPPVTKPAGFYLDEAPQWNWFWGMNERRKDQLACDLRFLEALGITGNAPALTAPIGEGADAFLSDMQMANAAHNATPWLAYAAAKRVAGRVGPVESASFLREAEARARAAGLVPPLWSVADEPGNADARGFNLAGWVQALRTGVPGIKLGAQLNTPADARLAPLFDTVIVNQGYGADAVDIARTKHSGPEVWLYNTGRLRATAGLWLWQTAATRYIQWHARMPTADPFDPLDGREADVQMFLPSVEACPAQPDINRAIFEMAEGLNDQRWLLWLAGQQSPEAAALAGDLQQRFGGRFEKAAALENPDLEAIRDSIVKLARETKLSQP
jgi:hypothetical protein